MFATKTFLLATLLAFQAFAVPALVSDTDDLVVIATEETSAGTLTFYGLAPGAKVGDTTSSNGDLTPRACGTNDVTCDTAHVPNASVCSSLIAALSNDPGRGLPQSPRSVCLTNGSTCCVSWANVVPGLAQGQLVSAASKARDTCVNAGLSGATTNTNLNGVCTRQCLSNRATGC